MEKITASNRGNADAANAGIKGNQFCGFGDIFATNKMADVIHGHATTAAKATCDNRGKLLPLAHDQHRRKNQQRLVERSEQGKVITVTIEKPRASRRNPASCRWLSGAATQKSASSHWPTTLRYRAHPPKAGGGPMWSEVLSVSDYSPQKIDRPVGTIFLRLQQNNKRHSKTNKQSGPLSPLSRRPNKKPNQRQRRHLWFDRRERVSRTPAVPRKPSYTHHAAAKRRHPTTKASC